MSPNSVAVVDYGMGNLRSVAQAVMHAAQDTGVEVKITSNPQDVRDATRVVLPGQGAMPDCMRELRDSGLMEAVLDAAAKKPLFGVCVGMQMLLDHSAEGGEGGADAPQQHRFAPGSAHRKTHDQGLIARTGEAADRKIGEAGDRHRGRGGDAEEGVCCLGEPRAGATRAVRARLQARAARTRLAGNQRWCQFRSP